MKNRFVDTDSFQTVFIKTTKTVGQQANRVKEIVDDHRPIDIEFKLATGAAPIDRHIITKDLAANHGHGFALRGIDLSGHHRGARFVFRQLELVKACIGSAAHPAKVVCNFHEACREGLQGSVRKNESVVAGQCFKFIGGAEELFFGQFAQAGGKAFCKLRVCILIQNGSHYLK